MYLHLPKKHQWLPIALSSLWLPLPSWLHLLFLPGSLCFSLYSCTRVFALADPYARNTLPPNNHVSHSLTPPGLSVQMSPAYWGHFLTILLKTATPLKPWYSLPWLARWLTYFYTAYIIMIHYILYYLFTTFYPNYNVNSIRKDRVCFNQCRTLRAQKSAYHKAGAQ